jgi:hypothetical protein
MRTFAIPHADPPFMNTPRAMILRIQLAILLLSSSAHGGILRGPISNPANGQTYYLLTANTWTASQTEAVSLGGNLVTIHDEAENDWVFETFSGGQRNLWIGLSDLDAGGVFSWVDSSLSSFRNWDAGPSAQPDGNDRYVLMARGDLGQGLTARKWHDVGNDPAAQFAWLGPTFGVVAAPCARHRAAATARVDNGFVVEATITDAGCGYTNPPLVVVQGGGGTGATATAVVSNGVVVQITITNAGIGYTNDPTLYIYSPTGLEVGLVRAVRPSFSDLLVGTHYQLQISGDMKTWANHGTPFTAGHTTMTYPDYFDVDNWASLFFRLQVVP